jgi:alanine racemase
MHRQGIPYTEIDAVIRLMHRAAPNQIEGVFSHFADADVMDSVLTAQQIARWNELAHRLQRDVPTIRYYHMANSSGFRYADTIIANVGRSGNMLYGTNPGHLPIALRPVLKMTSIISDIRTIEAGESVGYNGTFVAEHRMRIATIPAGYYEGITRRLSNKGSYIIEGRRAPIIGRVSMNISSCDVTDIPHAQIGSLVTLISNRTEDQNSVVNIAQMCDTIPYDILVHIPAHLHRVLVA